MIYAFPGVSSQGCPVLRASNEHILIVRVLRARRTPGRSLRILRRPRVARAQKIISFHPVLCGLFQHPAKVRLIVNAVATVPAPILRMTRRTMAEGARFENPRAPETMGSNLVSSFRSQSLTAESEAGDEPINTDRRR
jgi:hypothetical protein